MAGALGTRGVSLWRGASTSRKRASLVGTMQVRTRRYSNERVVVLGVFGLATALCVALEAFREHHYGWIDFRFLLWNLFLAWIPLLLALAVYDGYRRDAPLAVLAPGAVLWLLFLPNAPYLVTDFVHLAPYGPPLWFDGVLLSTFAWTGLLLGFVSLYLMHALVRHRFGARAGWVGAVRRPRPDERRRLPGPLPPVEQLGRARPARARA